MAKDIVVCILFVAVVCLAVTESRDCVLKINGQTCLKNCCGPDGSIYCLNSCVGSRCIVDNDCDTGGCCNRKGYCESCPRLWSCSTSSRCSYNNYLCSCSFGSCQNCFPRQPRLSSSSSSSDTAKIAGIISGCASLALIVFLTVAIYCYCNRRRRQNGIIVRAPAASYPKTSQTVVTSVSTTQSIATNNNVPMVSLQTSSIPPTSQTVVPASVLTIPNVTPKPSAPSAYVISPAVVPRPRRLLPTVPTIRNGLGMINRAFGGVDLSDGGGSDGGAHEIAGELDLGGAGALDLASDLGSCLDLGGLEF